jgi:hypothetical protein
MYCPKCGKENSESQKFCRSCGLSLQPISHALVHELTPTKPAVDPDQIPGPERKRWQNSLAYGFFMLILGMIIVIFGRKIVVEQLIADIGVLIAMLGIGLFGFKGVLLILGDSRNPQQSQLLESKPTAKLPTQLHAGEAPSVTEHTTRNFEPIYPERKTE